MKSFVILSLLFLGTLATNPATELTEALDGIFEEESLPLPKLLPLCYDANATLSQEVDDFIASTLKTASEATNPDNFLNFSKIMVFFFGLPPKNLDCILKNNST